MRISCTMVAAVATMILAAALAPAAGARVATPIQAENARPKLTLLSMRLIRSRVYARLRICDDARRNLVVFARESQSGVAPYTRRFTTTTPPRPCASYSRSWTPAPRFRGRGNYIVTVWVRDVGGLTSRRLQTTFLR